MLLSEFFRELPYEVYRVKGFVRFAQDPSKVFLIQKVGARFTIEEVENPSDRSKNTLVFIGSEIQPFLINIELAKCSSL